MTPDEIDELAGQAKAELAGVLYRRLGDIASLDELATASTCCEQAVDDAVFRVRDAAIEEWHEQQAHARASEERGLRGWFEHLVLGRLPHRLGRG